MYFIISLKYTLKEDKYMTLMRPKGRGYCYNRDLAGFYEKPFESNINSLDNVAISVFQGPQLFIKGNAENSVVEEWFIPNNQNTWNYLDLIMTDEGLKRKEIRSS